MSEFPELNELERLAGAIERAVERLNVLEASMNGKQQRAAGGEDEKHRFFRALFDYYVARRAPDGYNLQVRMDTGDVAALVPTAISEQINALASTDGLSSLARTIRTDTPVFTLPILNQAGVTSGNPWAAGAAVGIVGEGSAIAESEPSFTYANVVAYNVAALTPVTIQLAQDVSFVVDYIPNVFSDALKAWKDNMMLNGTGTNQPLGITHSPALLSVNHTGTDTITKDDVLGMLAAFAGNARRARWVCSNSALPHIWKLKAEYLNDTGDPMSLLGIPIFVSQYVSSAGSDNSLLLIDPEAYVFGVLREARIDMSEGPGFASATIYYRYMTRIGGVPRVNGKIKLANGEYVSPFVGLNYA